MRSRRLLAIGLAAGSLLGIGLYARRGKAHERIDLYFADGSLISLHGDSPQAAALLAHAREALRAAGA
jgi:hypothetical protein